MEDYTQFPPVKYFTRALKTCPKSALLYAHLWKDKNKDMHFTTDKKDIRKNYLISATIFRNLLMPLAFLNLIVFIEIDGKFKIHMLGTHEDE